MKSTVLILGAGASAPYGFPTGRHLRELLVQYFAQPSGVPFKMVSELYAEKEIREFGKAFKLSLQYSIDRFLRHNPQYMDVGKAAIASILMDYEQRELLYSRPSSSQDLRFLGDSWYEYLVDRLTTVDSSEFPSHPLAIITFNYDRSLEYALYNALMHTYHCSGEDAISLLRHIPILHIHGQLGYLPGFSKENVVKYGRGRSVENVRVAAKNLQIIHENRREQHLLKQAHKAIEEAERIIFLGFGYDEENMRILKLDQINLKPKIVRGTAKGLTNAELNRAYQFMKPVSFTPSRDACRKFDCLAALRHIRDF